MLKHFFLIACVLLLSVTLHAQDSDAEMQHYDQKPSSVYYAYAGNYKAWVSYPATMIPDKKYPVVIYNYDEFVDWIGPKLAKKRGYDLFAIMKRFNKWGMICVMPQERHHKLNALKGAVIYAKKLPAAGKIHVVGMSEGAFLSILALESSPDVSSITAILPQSIHDTGKFSLAEVLRQKDIAKIPLLLILGTAEKHWRIKDTQIIQRIYAQNNQQINIKSYHEKREWFWKPDQIFMWDIYNYIIGGTPPVTEP
jgi:dienelactone hydrolase